MTSSIFPLSLHSSCLSYSARSMASNWPNCRGGVGQTRGLPRIRMHVERKIAMHQIHLARNHVIVDHLLYVVSKKSAARGTFKIAEDLHRDGRVRRADGFRKVVVPSASNLRPEVSSAAVRKQPTLHDSTTEKKNSDPTDWKLFHLMLSLGFGVPYSNPNRILCTHRRADESLRLSARAG